MSFVNFLYLSYLSPRERSRTFQLFQQVPLCPFVVNSAWLPIMSHEGHHFLISITAEFTCSGTSYEQNHMVCAPSCVAYSPSGKCTQLLSFPQKNDISRFFLVMEWSSTEWIYHTCLFLDWWRFRLFPMTNKTAVYIFFYGFLNRLLVSFL